MFNFLILLFLAGILIATVQDLRRREVDNYVNFFLLASGAGYLVFSAIFNWNYWILVFGLVSFVIMFALANVFYYSRIFAGGDAKLMIAMFVLFAGLSFRETLINIGIFILFLLFAGAAYGLIYSLYLFFRDYSRTKMQFKKEVSNIFIKISLITGIILVILGIFDMLFLVLGIFVFLFGILFAFAKSIEKVSMIKLIYSRDLREGDWLAEDIRVKGKTIKQDWEGLTKVHLKLLKNLKRKIKIKEGIAFVPAFLIAFIAFIFRQQIINFILNII